MVTRQEMDELLAHNLIYFGSAPDYNNTPRLKIFPTDTNNIIPSNLLSEYDSTRKAQGELDNLMEKHVFDNPKPVNLIEHLIEICGVKDDDIVMDFFAGSGTTGHAALNKEAKDGLQGRYILVQYPEKLDNSIKIANNPTKNTIKNCIEYLDKLGKPHEISEITIERIRRATSLVSEEYHIDTGFRVFRIDSSNESEDIRRPLGQSNQLVLSDTIDNIKKDRTPLDLLFGIVYASALPFDLKLETRKISDNTVYLYGYLDEETGLVACFDSEVPEATVKEIAELKPLTAAFRDSSFKDSAEKINLSEHFRVISPNTKVKVI